MKMQSLLNLLGLISGVLLLSGCNPPATVPAEEAFRNLVMQDPELNDKEKLGKLLFFENALSTPEGQSCSFCHDPKAAFADPNYELPVSKGAIEGRYGNRNDMPVSYAAFVPPLHYDEEEEVWVGGLFWDGRSNTLTEQAMQPPLNPLEMANPDTITIQQSLIGLPYADMFTKVYGEGALATPAVAFLNMADAMEAYQRTPEVNPFSSKYDHYLRGEVLLTEQEMRGLALFIAEDKGNCVACHPVTPLDDGTPPLFTDFTYDNLGVPVNAGSPFLLLPPELNPDGMNYIDPGLAATVNDQAEFGKFRVPTLRNVGITQPYMHNGYFRTLWDVVAFYNTRDIAPWPAPEVAETMNRDEMGDLGLTNLEIEDIIAFMLTLTDGFTPQAK